MTEDGLEMPAFVRATIRRTVVAGAAIALALGFVLSIRFGLSVAAAAGLAAANFAAIAAIARRMFDRNAGRDGDRQRPLVWTALLVGKMLMLLTAAAVLVLLVGVDPIALAVGYTIFVAAAIWSALETARRTDAAG